MLQKFALIVKLSIIISVLSDVKNGSSMYKILSKYCQTGKESSSCNPVSCEICTFNRDEAVLSTSIAPHPGSQVSTYFGPVTQGYRFTQNSDISIERETCEKNKWRMKYWWYCVAVVSCSMWRHHYISIIQIFYNNSPNPDTRSGLKIMNTGHFRGEICK